MSENDPFATPDDNNSPLAAPPGPEDPFADQAASGGGGYLASNNDDEEVRKINRRVSPFGKVLALLIVGGIGTTGYFIAKSAQEEAAASKAQTEGRAALDRLLAADQDRAQLPAKVRELYQQYKASEEVRMACRRLLARLRDAQSVDIMIEGVRRRGNERRQAALAIAELGPTIAGAAKDALMAALADSDERVDRADITWALVVLGESRAWDTVVKMLSEGKLQQVRDLENRPFFDPALVSRLAGRERLIQLATDTSGTAQQQNARKRIAASALSEMATPEVFDTLVTLSRDSDEEVATIASIGLGRSGDNRASQPVLAFLNAHPTARDRVLNALAQNSGAPGLSVIGQNATDVTTRRQAVRLLMELQDPTAGDALFAIMNSIPVTETNGDLREIRTRACFGLADIGDARAADGLLEIAKYPIGRPFDANADMEAKQAMDKLVRIPGAAARVKAGLLELLPRADFMRTQILLALGATEDASIGPQVARYLTDEQAQEGAARAVCRLRYAPGIQTLRGQIRRPPNVRMDQQTIQNEQLYIKRRNAIRGLAWSGDARIAADLMRIIEDSADEPRLREDAGNTLATIADDAALQQVAQRALDTTKPADVRGFYLRALRVRSTPQIATQLVSAYLKPGEDVNVMRFAAIAAGFGGDESTIAAVRPLLASTDANVRLHAGMAAVLLGTEGLATALVDALVANRDFADLLAPNFVTRGSQTAGPTMMEPIDLMPLTEAMFENGAVNRRIEGALVLERGRGTDRYDFAIQWLRTRIRSGWDHPTGITPYAVRDRIRRQAQGSDVAQRDVAFKILRSLNDRGSLLFLRRGTGESAEIARRVLLELNSASN
jgi:HEAT repeat protein